MTIKYVLDFYFSVHYKSNLVFKKSSVFYGDGGILLWDSGLVESN